METHVNSLFHIRKDKKSKQGLYPIYLRITINGERFEYSTQRYGRLRYCIRRWPKLQKIVPGIILLRVISSKKLMDESVTRENVRELSLEDICQLCQLNVFNLNRGFWALYGNSPMQYYYELKFNLALSLLAETDESITHISNLMNFNNVAYFCLLFKRKFNETPSQNRDRVKRKKGRKR